MRTRTEQFLPFALLLPSILFLGLLIVIPMIQALFLAILADEGGFTLEHFQRMASDVNFSDAWRNTLLLLLLIVPLQIVLALAIVLIMIAGLQLIPRDFSEAADLFGATRFRRTVHVVLPLLRPSLQSALIIRTIFALQTFAVVFALAGRNMPVLAGEAYTWYAANRNEHLAAAYAVLLLALTAVATVVYLRVLGLREAEVQR